MASIPAPIRVTLGLLATALDTVQELVEHAPELPMEAVGNSMQLSLRLQQHYAALLTRGDEFLANLRGAPEEAPAWATFDESPAADVSEPPAADEWASDGAVADDLPPAHRESRPRGGGQGDPLFAAVVTATAPANKAPRKAAKSGLVTVSEPSEAAATKVTATKVTASKVTAKKITSGTKRTATKAPAATTPEKAAKKAAAKAPAAPTALAKKAAKQAATVPTTLAEKAAPAKKAARLAAKKVIPAPQDRVTETPENRAPVKRAPRRARKVSAPTSAAAAAERTAVTATLDTDLDDAAASARQLSAFDLAEDASAPGSTPADPS